MQVTKRVVAVMGLDRTLKCDHDFIRMQSGGMHFSGGEVWDDIKIEYRCKLCGDLMPDEPSEEDIDDLEVCF